TCPPPIQDDAHIPPTRSSLLCFVGRSGSLGVNLVQHGLNLLGGAGIQAFQLGEVLLGHQTISLSGCLRVGGVLSRNAQTSDVLLGDSLSVRDMALSIHSHLVQTALLRGV